MTDFVNTTSTEAATQISVTHEGAFWRWFSTGGAKILVAFIGSLVAAIAPITTYITEDKELEATRARQVHDLAMQQEQQLHGIRMDFLEKVVALEKTSDVYYRRDVLAFFAAALDEPSDGSIDRMKGLREWAKSELAQTQKEIDELAQAKRDLEKTRTLATTLELEVSRLTSRASLLENQGQRSNQALVEARKNLEEIRLKADDAQWKAQQQAVQLGELETILDRSVSETCRPPGRLFTSRGRDGAARVACGAVRQGAAIGETWEVQLNQDSVKCGCNSP